MKKTILLVTLATIAMSANAGKFNSGYSGSNKDFNITDLWKQNLYTQNIVPVGLVEQPNITLGFAEDPWTITTGPRFSKYNCTNSNTFDKVIISAETKELYDNASSFSGTMSKYIGCKGEF